MVPFEREGARVRHGEDPIGLRGVLGVDGKLHVSPLRRTRLSKARLALARVRSRTCICLGSGGLVVWGSSPVWHTGRRERPHTKRMKAERCSGENLVGGSVVGGEYQVAGDGRVEVVSSIVSG